MDNSTQQIVEDLKIQAQKQLNHFEAKGFQEEQNG